MNRILNCRRDCAKVNGLLVTRPARIVADLLEDGEDLAILGQLNADALREAKASPEDVTAAIAPHAVWFGFAEQDGSALLNWLLCWAAQPQQRLQPLPCIGNEQGQAASIDQQFVLVRATEVGSDNAAGTTIHPTTDMRQGLPRRCTPRRQPSLSS